MKILYLIDRPNLYGSELHTQEVIQHFREGNEVILLSLQKGPLLERIESLGVKVKVVKTGWKDLPLKLFSLKKIVEDYKPDIIHGHQPKAIFIASLIGWLSKIPAVITVHSKPVDNANLRSGLLYYIVYSFHWIVSYKAQLFAKKIIFVSKDMLRMGFFRQKSTMIYNWISPKITGKSKLEIKQIGQKGKLNIISVGSITKAKGYLRLIQLLSRLKPDIDFHLKILGDGDDNYIALLKQKIEEYQITDKIEFMGYQEDVGKFLSASDVFILFSKSESFGLSYIEAMYFGLPVMGSDLAVLHEIVPEGNCLTDDLKVCRDYLLELGRDEDLYKKISVTNQKKVQKDFDYESNMKKINDIYSSLVQ